MSFRLFNQIFFKNNENILRVTFLSDKLNFFITTYLYAFIFIGVTSNQLLGKQILCWTPSEFSFQMIDYTNHYCWSNVKSNENILIFYKWTPFLMMILLCFYYAPNIIWLKFLKVTNVYQLILKTDKCEIDKLLNIFIEKYKIQKGIFFVRQISLYYLLSKFLYVFNIFFQFYVFNIFLDRKFLSLGHNYLKTLRSDSNKNLESIFPRIALCNFSVRTLGNNIHSYQVECLLTLNEFYEKIYIFLWFWLVFMLIVNMFSFSKSFYDCFLLNMKLFSKKIILNNIFRYPDLIFIKRLLELNDFSYKYNSFELNKINI